MIRLSTLLLFCSLASAAPLQSAKEAFGGILHDFSDARNPCDDILTNTFVSLKEFKDNGGDPFSYSGIEVAAATLQVRYNSSLLNLTVAEIDRLKMPMFYFYANLFPLLDYQLPGKHHTKIGYEINELELDALVVTAYIWGTLAVGSLNTANRHMVFVCFTGAFANIHYDHDPRQEEPNHGTQLVIVEAMKKTIEKVRLLEDRNDLAELIELRRSERN